MCVFMQGECEQNGGDVVIHMLSMRVCQLMHFLFSDTNMAGTRTDRDGRPLSASMVQRVFRSGTACNRHVMAESTTG